jgi:hypothetical protein
MRLMTAVNWKRGKEGRSVHSVTDFATGNTTPHWVVLSLAKDITRWLAGTRTVSFHMKFSFKEDVQNEVIKIYLGPLSSVFGSIWNAYHT